MLFADISQLLLVLAANHEDTKQYVKEYAPHVIQRADEPATVLAIQFELFEDELPRQLRKGVRDSLFNFDEYQFSKYMNTRRQVNLRDVVNLTHPDPTSQKAENGAADNYEALFEQLMKGGLDKYNVEPLEPPRTWEVEVSDAVEQVRHHYGEEDAPQDEIDEAKEQAYRDLLDNNRLGLFAKIRNIRNMLDIGIGGDIIFDGEDMDHVKNAKVYPFRFYQAYKAMKQSGVKDDMTVEQFLSNAVDIAAESLDDNLTSTFTAVDLSGSMKHAISNKSTMQRVEIGALFGAMMMRHGSDTGVFGTDFELVSAHKDTPTLELQDKIMNKVVGSATNGHLAIRHLIDQEKVYDRVVIFTDEQLWNTSQRSRWGSNNDSLKQAWDDYKEQINSDASLYIIDLASYGDLSMPEGYPDVYQIQGWTSKVLDFIEHAENEDALIRDVKQTNV